MQLINNNSVSKSIVAKNNWDNAVAMATHSLKPMVSNVVPKNFVSLKNAAPRGIQNYDLALTAAVEGYSSNLWATPKQIASIGGEISNDAAMVPIFMEKTSKAGNRYYHKYVVVNLDCVNFPTGSIAQKDYDAIMTAASMDEEFVIPQVPAPKPLSEKTVTVKLIDAAPKKYAPKPQKPAPRKANVLDKRDKTAGVNPEDKKTAPVVIDIKELGIHIEARCSTEAQMALDMAVEAYKAIKGTK